MLDWGFAVEQERGGRGAEGGEVGKEVGGGREVGGEARDSVWCQSCR